MLQALLLPSAQQQRDAGPGLKSLFIGADPRPIKSG
jgi:hypothetical protein